MYRRDVSPFHFPVSFIIRTAALYLRSHVGLGQRPVGGATGPLQYPHTTSILEGSGIKGFPDHAHGTPE